MQVPLLDLRPQIEPLREALHQACCELLDSGQYILGKPVETLERQIADYCGTRFAVGVSSGTDALLVSLMALGVGRDDLVITPAFSFFATAGVVVRVGATPVFIDIDPQTCNLDPQALETWLAEHPAEARRVRAIIPVHLYGQCAEMEPILRTASRYDIPVIEDAAQAIGATCPFSDGRVRKAGSMGRCGCFSFFPTKNLGGAGDGGMVVTDDAELAGRIRLLRNHGAERRYYHRMVGGNFRLDALQAAVLSVKLPQLERWHQQRRANAALYDELLADLPQVTRPVARFGPQHHVYNQYVIQAERRDALREHLTARDIATAIYYPVPFHHQECFEKTGFLAGPLETTERICRTCLALPVYPGLTPEMIRYVAGQIHEFYRGG